MSNKKKVFLKAPSRVGTFKEKCLNLSLPPQPIITRWRMWLDGAFYYSKNFDIVKEVIDTFNSNDAKSIQNTQQLFNDNSIKNELSIILSNFQCITDTIKCLEKSGVNLGKSLELVQNVEDKLSEVLAKNPGLSQLKKNSEIISRKIINNDEDLVELSSEDISCFKYAPIVSVTWKEVFRKIQSYVTRQS